MRGLLACKADSYSDSFFFKSSFYDLSALQLSHSLLSDSFSLLTLGPFFWADLLTILLSKFLLMGFGLSMDGFLGPFVVLFVKALLVWLLLILLSEPKPRLLILPATLTCSLSCSTSFYFYLSSLLTV